MQSVAKSNHEIMNRFNPDEITETITLHCYKLISLFIVNCIPLCELKQIHK